MARSELSLQALPASFAIRATRAALIRTVRTARSLMKALLPHYVVRFGRTAILVYVALNILIAIAEPVWHPLAHLWALDNLMLAKLPSDVR